MKCNLQVDTYPLYKLIENALKVKPLRYWHLIFLHNIFHYYSLPFNLKPLTFLIFLDLLITIKHICNNKHINIKILGSMKYLYASYYEFIDPLYPTLYISDFAYISSGSLTPRTCVIYL